MTTDTRWGTHYDTLSQFKWNGGPMIWAHGYGSCTDPTHYDCNCAECKVTKKRAEFSTYYETDVAL